MFYFFSLTHLIFFVFLECRCVFFVAFDLNVFDPLPVCIWSNSVFAFDLEPHTKKHAGSAFWCFSSLPDVLGFCAASVCLIFPLSCSHSSSIFGRLVEYDVDECCT